MGPAVYNTKTIKENERKKKTLFHAVMWVNSIIEIVIVWTSNKASDLR